MSRVRRLALIVLVAIPAFASAAPLNRPADPVLLTGAAVPSLAGVPPGDIVAFRWADSWQQVPVQVDERALIDLSQPFGSYTCSGSPYCFGLPSPDSSRCSIPTPRRSRGADPISTLDEDDEIVFMARGGSTCSGRRAGSIRAQASPTWTTTSSCSRART